MNIQDQVDSAVRTSLMTTGAIIVVSLVFAVVVIIFVRRYVGRMTGADLRSSGIVAQATILRFWDTGTTVNDNPVAGLLLEVQAPGQAPYQVETKSLIPRLSIGQLQPGAVVQVKIDPTNNQRVALDLFAA
jgi:hypothetical protein